MKRKFNKNLFISIFFFLLFVGIVAATELNFFKAFTTVEVVVAAEDLQTDKVLTEDDVTIMRISREYVNDGMLRNVNQVIGKTTTQTVLASQFISTATLDTSIIRPTADHEFFPIPDDWLMDIQGTLRRYDLVNISTIFVGKVEGAADNSGALRARIQDEFVLEEVPVAYVRGGKNQEVTNITPDDKRLYGSQMPSGLELSLTLEEFKELEALYLEGYKLIISY